VTRPQPGAPERRDSPRVPARVEAAYEDADRQLFLMSRDLSESGIFLLAPDPPTAGGAARLTLELPGFAELLRVRGEVVRSQRAEPAGFAVRFDASSFSDGARSSLRRWLQETASSSPQ
jgi:hypothetical protein